MSMKAVSSVPVGSPRFAPRVLSVAAALVLCAGAARAVPTTTPLLTPGFDDTAGVAAAAFAGAYATTDTFEDSVEIRDARLNLTRTITRAEIQALAPWLALDGGPDGPSAVALSASGRLAFILVHDDTVPADGLPSDAVLRLDLGTGALALFARLDAFDRGDIAPHLALAHHRGLLWVGTNTAGIRVYSAGANTTAGTLLTTWTLPAAGAGQPVTGITIDRDASTLFASTPTAVYRANIPTSTATAPTWTTLVSGSSDIRAIAWAEHFGGTSNRGLYLLRGTPTPPGARIDVVSYFDAFSTTPVTPTLYTTSTTPQFDLAATAEGALLVGADEDALIIRDTADTRLTFDAWLTDEFTQVATFARRLISPDGEPAGWVIDADTDLTINRFHPATPDAAGWTVLMLLMADHLFDDAQAKAQVTTVLTRYAGLSTDNIRPSRTTDGIYRHWIDPLTGQAKPGWDPEFATLSTMKIVAAAARAAAMYPDDPAIVRAAHRIIFRTRNYDPYIQTFGSRAMAFKGAAAGGPDFGSFAAPFHEGVIFVEQAATYGGSSSQSAFTAWLNRAALPSATLLTGQPVTSTANGLFEASFISLYPALLTPSYRASTAWQAQVNNLRWSHAAWTDDNAPRYFTVFSAGTTKPEWGGYNADSLSNRPGNVTTFTSLLAMSALGDASPAVSAYHAYRKGARQTFRTGASILYRRSDIDRAYLPNSAGLPDVALGALGIADLIQPGSIDAVLARAYPTIEQCPTDVNADGAITVEDLYRHVAAPTDLNGDGATNASDTRCLAAWLRRNESTDTRTR